MATPVHVDPGNMIPDQYEGDLTAFVLLDNTGRPVGEGARFSDGRCVISRDGGELYERYATEDRMARDWLGRARFLWRGPALVDPDFPVRRFLFIRDHDTTGFSGTGIAVEGAQFSHGGVVLRWLGALSSLVEWSCLAAAIACHGHNGDTRVHWLDHPDG